MIKKVGLQQYVESREQLLEAVKRDPIIDLNYTISKYCKLVVEQDGNETELNLKPKMGITVRWKYLLTNERDLSEVDRDLLQVTIENMDGSTQTFRTVRKTKPQLERWIKAHVRENR